jgi:exodeoxyribonuclease VII large subunit
MTGGREKGEGGMAGDPGGEGRREILTVSEVTGRVKRLLEREIGSVWIRGELSSFRVATSGHGYGILKDARSQIRVLLFRQTLGVLGFQPQDGMEMLARGRVSVYEPRGDYQIICEWMEPFGRGAAALALEQLRKKLAAEGLFDPERKREVPYLPRRIGLVTSLAGAALRDVLRVLSRRYGNLHILLSPCKVQGAEAPGEIVSALRLLEGVKALDVVLLTRGGGTAEDLSAFNHEAVVRAIASCSVPVVSAVGHEIDWTLADLVADLRCATPSSAAERVVREKAVLEERVGALARALKLAAGDHVTDLRRRVAEARRRLPHPRRRLEEAAQRLDDLGERLTRGVQRELAGRRHSRDSAAGRLLLLSPRARIREGRDGTIAAQARLDAGARHLLAAARAALAVSAGRLETLSPLGVLERGYSITRLSATKRIVREPADAPPGELLEIRVQRGLLHARAEQPPGRSRHGPRRG